MTPIQRAYEVAAQMVDEEERKCRSLAACHDVLGQDIARMSQTAMADRYAGLAAKIRALKGGANAKRTGHPPACICEACERWIEEMERIKG